jgi:hypothetical protein
MLKILIDAAVLAGILSVLLGKDAPDFKDLILVSLGMGVANFVCALALMPVIGYLVILPILAIDGLILMYFCSLTPKYATITLGILLVYNVLYQVAWSMMIR